jgi:hypothetical protein
VPSEITASSEKKGLDRAGVIDFVKQDRPHYRVESSARASAQNVSEGECWVFLADGPIVDATMNYRG